MRLAMMVFGFVLGGCAAQWPPQPVAARLSLDVLVVTLSDGSVCRTEWAAGSGRMEECGAGLNWQVVPEPNPNPLRYVFAELAAALEMQAAVPPMALISLNDGVGRGQTFLSPPPVER